jgi:hypothetical protein
MKSEKVNLLSARQRVETILTDQTLTRRFLRLSVIPWRVSRGSITQKLDPGRWQNPQFYCTFWNSRRTKFLWVPQLGAPTVGGRAELTFIEIDT